MTDDIIDLTDYQRSVLNSADGRRIFIGARQTGKTEIAVREALRAAHAGTVAVPAYMQRYAEMFIERCRERAETFGMDYRSTRSRIDVLDGGEINVFSTYNYTRYPFTDFIQDVCGTTEIDQFVVDEASFLPETMLFEMDRFTGSPGILATATPTPSRHIVEVWAESDRRWSTTHASMYDAPFIERNRIQEFRESIPDEQVAYEVEGVYKREDRP